MSQQALATIFGIPDRLHIDEARRVTAHFGCMAIELSAIALPATINFSTPHAQALQVSALLKNGQWVATSAAIFEAPGTATAVQSPAAVSSAPAAKASPAPAAEAPVAEAKVAAAPAATNVSTFQRREPSAPATGGAFGGLVRRNAQRPAAAPAGKPAAAVANARPTFNPSIDDNDQDIPF